MFFDDIIDKNPELHVTSHINGKTYLKDAILFRVDNSIFQDSLEYWRGKKRVTDHEIDYARVPYQSIFIYFGGTRGYWVMGEPTKNFYGIGIFAFDHLSDDIARKFPAGKNKNISEQAAPELKQFNLYPRLSAISIDLKERKVGIPILAGFPIEEETNLNEPPFLNTYHANSLAIMRILTLLNCVNVIKEKHLSPAPNSKIQKARQRRGKLPLASYYTLKIDLGERNQGCSMLKDSPIF